MATENKSKQQHNKKRRNYLPHNKPVKKGCYPLCPGVEGFFITCDGGREYQASQEAINVIDSFYEELLDGAEPKIEQANLAKKPLNKVIKFASSDSSGSEDDDVDGDKNDDHPKNGHDGLTIDDNNKHVIATCGDVSNESEPQNEDGVSSQNIMEENEEKPEDRNNPETDAVGPPIKKQKKTEENEKKPEDCNNQESEAVVPLVMKQCTESAAPNSGNGFSKKVVKKSVDELIEAELAELGDKSKRRFSKLESGCNGVVFVQMRKRDGDPSPKDIVQHMMTSLASTKKHVSRFLLRILPIEVACYTSEEEIKRAIKPVIDKYFPVETQIPRKFAVLYDARANTGIDRKKIIDTVAKAVPPLHKVDLGNPDMNIVVQIVKTVCLIGVVEKYKELAKYNLRQLTSSDE